MHLVTNPADVEAVFIQNAAVFGRSTEVKSERSLEMASTQARLCLICVVLTLGSGANLLESLRFSAPPQT